MKILKILFLLLPFLAFGQTAKTDAALVTQANVIKNETVTGANTAVRVGNMFLDDIASKVNSNQYAKVVANGTDTYTATVTPAITSYTTGYTIFVRFINANTGAATINLNSLGVRAIKKNSTEALIAFDIKNLEAKLLYYDGTNFQMVGSSGGGGDFWKTSGTTTMLSNVTIDGDEDNNTITIRSGLSTALSKVVIDPSGQGSFSSSNGSFSNSFIPDVPTDDFSSAAVIGTYDLGVSSSNPDFGGILFGGDFSANYGPENATSVRYVDSHFKGLTFTNSPSTGNVPTHNGTNWTFSTPSGTVSSVSFTGGLISVATATTTPALTVAGTSGGIPYFSSTSTWASSGLLATNSLMIGGGAGASPSTTTTGTGVLTFLGTPSYTNFLSMITGTSPYWSLASGGTLTGVNTITSNATGQLIWTGGFTGSGIYEQNTATLTASANSQELVLMDLNPTFVPGAFTTLKQTALRVRSGTSVFGASTQVGTGSASATVEIRGLGDDVVRWYSSAGGLLGTIFGGSSRISLGSSVAASWLAANNGVSAAAGQGNIIQGTLTTGTTNNLVLRIAAGTFSLNSSNTQRFVSIGDNFNPISGSTNVIDLDFSDMTINQTGTASGNITLIKATPVVTALLGTYYPFVSSGNGKHGFNQLTPTAIVHVTGAGTTTGSTFLVENSAGTDRFEILDNGQWNVSGAAGTAGQVLTSGGTGATPTWSSISGWSITGNTGTTAGTNFIGTTDAIDFVIKTNNTEKLRATSDGRLYGTALHNNAGAVTGATNQYVASGTYTPTLTNIANLDASTAYVCQWIRVGNVVTVSGRVSLDQTITATQTQIRVSLPIASAISAAEQAGGNATTITTNPYTFAIYADAANDAVIFDAAAPTATTDVSYYFSFTYLIL